MTTEAQWRRRCIAAEERASTAERTAKRLRSKVTRQADDLAETTNGAVALQRFATVATEVMERQAARHLGPDATVLEVRALVGRWLSDAEKTSKPRRRRPEVVAIQFNVSTDEFLRRLGIDPDEDD